MIRKEISYGIVPLRIMNGQKEILLAKTWRHSYFCIPKGHMERSDRAPIEAAMRELMEETGHYPTMFWSDKGWTADYMNASPIEPVEYHFRTRMGRSVEKSVVLFIAEVAKQTEIQDKEDIELIQWFPINEDTINLLHFRENIEHFLQYILPKINPNF
ncbi:unnamed protein product [Blepharisma stoltei]|uniref:Nudix hydrolase domain-containing protein n=1 Tax=Blepharisma stoltei TaxID=1481888 RepID=A0AAU9JYQ7_9CILI|nr:unnamed protein product [Blepharisma stoltei]